MKTILKIFCLILIFYAVWFPFSYFGTNNDKMEVRVSHIVVDTEEEAKNIKQNIQNGKNFEDIAKEYSSKQELPCGDIGFAQRGKLLENLENAVFKLNNNEISDPLQSEFGWHLVKVTNIKYYSDKENFKYNPYKFVKEL